jgi:hypothetical protein
MKNVRILYRGLVKAYERTEDLSYGSNTATVNVAANAANRGNTILG